MTACSAEVISLILRAVLPAYNAARSTHESGMSATGANGVNSGRAGDCSRSRAPASRYPRTDSGLLIVLDNVIREGRILEPESGDARVQATRQTLQVMGEHPRLDAAVIQTVGAKHWDGFALALVR